MTIKGSSDPFSSGNTSSSATEQQSHGTQGRTPAFAADNSNPIMLRFGSSMNSNRQSANPLLPTHGISAAGDAMTLVQAARLTQYSVSKPNLTWRGPSPRIPTVVAQRARLSHIIEDVLDLLQDDEDDDLFFDAPSMVSSNQALHAAARLSSSSSMNSVRQQLRPTRRAPSDPTGSRKKRRFPSGSN